eukprot:scaffold20920_cov67-Phaeocystis_antarctica.AAC.1
MALAAARAKYTRCAATTAPQLHVARALAHIEASILWRFGTERGNVDRARKVATRTRDGPKPLPAASVQSSPSTDVVGLHQVEQGPIARRRGAVQQGVPGAGRWNTVLGAPRCWRARGAGVTTNYLEGRRRGCGPDAVKHAESGDVLEQTGANHEGAEALAGFFRLVVEISGVFCGEPLREERRRRRESAKC